MPPGAGGDFDVSMYLQFRLIYGNEITNWIYANEDSTSDCSATADAIRDALESFDFFDVITVTGTSLSTSSMTCEWTVSFISSIGDIDQLQVMTRNQVSGNVGNIPRRSRVCRRNHSGFSPRLRSPASWH